MGLLAQNASRHEDGQSHAPEGLKLLALNTCLDQKSPIRPAFGSLCPTYKEHLTKKLRDPIN